MAHDVNVWPSGASPTLGSSQYTHAQAPGPARIARACDVVPDGGVAAVARRPVVRQRRQPGVQVEIVPQHFGILCYICNLRRAPATW